MIAALFVEAGGSYFGLDGVDPWDVSRDARRYAGPHPVVAHPPCARWCRLAGHVESRGGRRRGDDDGCFASALSSVRRWGGVLEHPAWSSAWGAFDLPSPTLRGWQRTIEGGWIASVDQGNYGHLAAKPTWLYAFGATELPSLLTQRVDAPMTALRSTKRVNRRPEIPKALRSTTPRPFVELLLEVARSSLRRAA